MKSARPSVSAGVSSSTAHASSSGESRPAVSSAIGSCKAAAIVWPGWPRARRARPAPGQSGHRRPLALAPARRPGGVRASGGAGTGRPSCGACVRRAARAGHSGDGSSCLGTRGQPRDCSRRRRADARRPGAFPGRARPRPGSGPAAPGSGRAPRRRRGAAAAVPAPAARRVPGAGESAGPNR